MRLVRNVQYFRGVWDTRSALNKVHRRALPARCHGATNLDVKLGNRMSLEMYPFQADSVTVNTVRFVVVPVHLVARVFHGVCLDWAP